MPVPFPSDRDLLIRYHASALEDNAIGASTERGIRVYLPPRYNENLLRYPVIYLLHGYGGSAEDPIVNSRAGLLASYPRIVRIVMWRTIRRIVTFEVIDNLIRSGTVPPFILAQPDGSLHIPHRYGQSRPSGAPKLKGSMYWDAPGVGRFGSAVFRDAVAFMDQEFRTVPERGARAVVGGSMGGYGALLAGILHPETFCAVAALSPSICGLDVLDIDLYVPLQRWILGKAGAREAGRADLADILDTCDMVFSPDRPLLPTIARDESGRTVSMDAVARANWAAADAGRLVEDHPEALRDVAVRVTCEERDEFGFAGPDRRFSDVLDRLGIEHEFVLFRDRVAARVSAHAVGIAMQVSDALKFCLEHMESEW